MELRWAWISTVIPSVIFLGMLTDGRHLLGNIQNSPGDKATGNDDTRNGEMWLEDYERLSEDIVRHFEMQADAPPPGFPSDQSGCPSFELELSLTSCLEANPTKCSVDADCTGEGNRCCFNPCIKANSCLTVPSVVDWTREPKRKKPGNSWLLGPNEGDRGYVDNSELCSTTPVDEDADPLLCPHGYTCEIEDEGDQANDMPNRGRCVPDSQNGLARDEELPNVNELSSNDQQFDIREHLPTELLEQGVCVYENLIITEGKTFAYHGLPCKCQEGKILCRVERPQFPVAN